MRWKAYAAGFALAAMFAASAHAQATGLAQPPAALTAQPAAPEGPKPLQEGVIATVNDDIISTYDLQQEMLYLIATSGIKVTQENLPQIQQEALTRLHQALESRGLKTRLSIAGQHSPSEVFRF